MFISNEIGLELNDKKTKYVVMSRDQHAVQKSQHIYIYIYIYCMYIYVINPLKGWNTSKFWEHP